MKILQIGLGNFGKNHLKAWHKLGRLADLSLAEPDRAQWEFALSFGLPPERIATDYQKLLEEAALVDIVTPTDSHHRFICESLRQGKNVFVEKPMTLNSEEAGEVLSLVQKTGRKLQVGFCFRYHPASRYAKQLLEQKALGEIRYLSGSFMGFKRPRTDVGVTHTDGIHFLDLFNWFLGMFPTELYAVTRDHLGRGLEDTSVVLLKYPNGSFAKVESGYIQPGRWEDKVVANAKTTKEIFISGSEKTLEVDYETGGVTLHDVRFEKKGGNWHPVFGKTDSPSLKNAGPVEMVATELSDFLESAKKEKTPSANAFNGWALALLIEAIYRSAKSGGSETLSLPQSELLLAGT